MKVKHRYFITLHGLAEREVSEAEYLVVENEAGFDARGMPFEVTGCRGRIKTEIEE